MHALAHLHGLSNAIATSLFGLFKFQRFGINALAGEVGNDQFFNLTAF